MKSDPGPITGTFPFGELLLFQIYGWDDNNFSSADWEPIGANHLRFGTKGGW